MWAILTIVQALCLFGCTRKEACGQIVTLPVERHSTVDLPCLSNICTEQTIAVQWYISSNPDAFIKGGKALAWWLRGGETGYSQGYGIKEDFSMIIHNVSLSDKGFYRCLVTQAGGAASEYDVKLDIYVNPYTPPLIEYFKTINGFNVTCSVSHVFPKTFPEFTSYAGHHMFELNEDETYNTIVSHLFPLSENDTSITCHYSNANFKTMSSLHINNYIDQPVNESPTNMSYPNSNEGGTLSGLWMVWMTLILGIPLLVIIAYVIKTALMKRCQNLHQSTSEGMGESSTEVDQTVVHKRHVDDERPGKPRRFVLGQCVGRKLYFAFMLLAIQFSVIFLLMAYLINMYAYEE